MLYLTYLSSLEGPTDGELEAEFAVVRAESENLAREAFIIESCLQRIDVGRIVVEEIAVDGEATPIALASGDGSVYPEVLR